MFLDGFLRICSRLFPCSSFWYLWSIWLLVLLPINLQKYIIVDVKFGTSGMLSFVNFIISRNSNFSPEILVYELKVTDWFNWVRRFDWCVFIVQYVGQAVDQVSKVSNGCNRWPKKGSIWLKIFLSVSFWNCHRKLFSVRWCQNNLSVSRHFLWVIIVDYQTWIFENQGIPEKGTLEMSYHEFRCNPSGYNATPIWSNIKCCVNGCKISQTCTAACFLVLISSVFLNRSISVGHWHHINVMVLGVCVCLCVVIWLDITKWENGGKYFFLLFRENSS